MITINFLHGRPAVGKDTQADLLTQKIPSSIKISGVYRSAFTQEGPYAKYYHLVAPYIKPLGQGIDIPGLAVSKILKDIVENKTAEGISTFIVCGLLRTVDHKKAIDMWLANESKGIKSVHIYLTTTEGRALDHAHTRRSNYSPSGLQRPDDTDELMATRLLRYKQNTLPMLKQLHDEGRLSIIRADRSITEVCADLQQSLGLIKSGFETMVVTSKL